MTSYFRTSPNTKTAESTPTSVNSSASAAAAAGAGAPPATEMNSHGFEVVAGDYMPAAKQEPAYRRAPYASAKPFFSDPNAGATYQPFSDGEEWAPVGSAHGGSSDAQLAPPPPARFHLYGYSPVSDTPSYDMLPMHHHRSPPPPPPPPVSAGAGAMMNPYTYRGPNADYTTRKQNRLHQDFKALPKEERQRLVEREAATSDLLARTVHLRFLPLAMLQSELAAICTECGEYLRVRICGNSTNNQNWIYGFVEFATTSGADAMMRRSGMELNNGPGRPPLRLKCNCAKQPIVDRVFHDADPATGNPCIFGLGNFAKRTLGDALESYYNLKEKEAQQLQQDAPATPSSINVSPHPGAAAVAPPPPPPLLGARPPMRLSPHARAFQPSSSPLLGAEYLPGVHNAAAMPLTPNSMHWTSPLPSVVAPALKVYSDAGSCDSATGMTPTETQHYTVSQPSTTTPATGLGASSSPGTTPRAVHTPQQDYSAFDVALYGSTPAAASKPTPTSMPAALRRPSFGSNRAATPLETVAAALSVSSERVGSISPNFFLPHSNGTCGAHPSGFPTPSDMAGNELSLVLQNMMLSNSATDGEEVLERGRELTLRAIGQAHCFLTSQQGFYDAMGTLRSLLELLDCHAGVTGGAVATGAGDHTAELPQRATQLRLLANLMMALLYMMKRNLSDALPYIHAVVMSCNEIPTVCLWKKPGTQQQRAGAGDTADVSRGDRFDATQRWHALAVGDSSEGLAVHAAEDAGGYDCFGAPGSFLEAVLESIREEDEDEDAAGSDEKAKSATTSVSNNGDTASTSSAEMQALLRRDQAFHRYVLNVLVAIGLSMEEVQPVISRSTYALASGRARDVLGTASVDLDECLESPGSNPHLCDRLLGPVPSAGCSSSSSGAGARNAKRDITFFPRLFFSTAEAMRQELTRCADAEMFWQCLPPKQCVQCYIE